MENKTNPVNSQNQNYTKNSQNLQNNDNTQNTSAKNILAYLLSNVSSNYEIIENNTNKIIKLKVLLNKNDYNFLLKNKVLLASIKTITMSYGAKLNKKILIDLVLKKNK
ncbi:MAG: hypothetical protein N2485_00290 [bacterium]|nr:hypothetical protein [bacterium]